MNLKLNIIPLMLQYQEIQPFSEGRAAVKKDDKWGFVDENGEEVIPCIYEYTSPFSLGQAMVVKDAGTEYLLFYIDIIGDYADIKKYIERMKEEYKENNA